MVGGNRVKFLGLEHLNFCNFVSRILIIWRRLKMRIILRISERLRMRRRVKNRRLRI